VRVLLIGSGGRESALALSLARSSVVDELVAAPGNPGIGRVAETVDIDVEDPGSVVEIARRVGAGLVVIGPEAPLVAGAGDALLDAQIKVFGPRAAAARIEGSKAHAKRLMEAAGIPTARWRIFSEIEAAAAFMDELGPPHVIKADGLAGGKGVVVTSDRALAMDALKERLVAGRFGEAGRRVVVEEFLDGEEASLIAFCDGTTVIPCEPAQDYKRVFDRDEGPNTGGMGSYSPVPACSSSLAEQITTEILEPMARATAETGVPFVGALYAGLALTSRGVRVVEFNCRFGDPETQALLPRLQTDLGEVCLAAADGQLAGLRLQWSEDPCVCVVLASEGYPGSYDVGRVISGLDEVEGLPGIDVFHAGTAHRDGELVTAGGRVLAVSALGPTFMEARALAYQAAALIDFDGKHFRTDIGKRAEVYETAAVPASGEAR